MLAVLEDALDCYQKYAFSRDTQGRQLFEEAHEWISSGNRDWFFSFENICETLEINPEYLRRGLEHWRHRLAAASRQVAAKVDSTPLRAAS